MDDVIPIAISMNHRIALLVMSVILLSLVVELMRRDLLKERYALLWLATSCAGLVVGCFPGLIVAVANQLHFQYLTVLFVVSFVFLLGLVLSFSIVISRLAERNRLLTQEVALLAHNVERLEKRRES